MSKTHYLHAVNNETGEQSITVFVIGVGQDSCDNTHPNFDRILAAASEGDPSVLELFDVEQAISTKFEKLSERVSVSNGVIYLDGDAVDNALTRLVVRFLDEHVEDWKPLIAFFEAIQANPNEHSREQLYAWLAADDKLTITPDGKIIGYKGVKKIGDDFVSITAGPGIVNGESQAGHLNNNPGNVVEMARSSVQHAPEIGCSVGLHVGTWAYASSFARGGILKVLVDPRDVVSVPTDCSAQKMRVCRYTVLEATEHRVESPIYEDEDYADYDGYEDEEYDDYDLDEEFEDDEDEPEDEPEDDEEAPVLNIWTDLFGFPR